jgi:cytochrome c oxidase subunit 3
MDEETGQQDVRILGLTWFLGGITMLLGASVVGYLIVRIRAEVWPPPGIPSVPMTLWISTAVLIMSSVTMHGALSGIREGNQRALKSGLILTMLLGLTFLVSQTFNGAAIYRAVLGETKEVFSFTFFMLTTLHAAHIIGGLIPLAMVTKNAFRGSYDEENHTGVRLVGIYWHYLDVVWFLMCVILTV